jgi:hypothetical protein
MRDGLRDTDPSLHSKGEHAVKYSGGTILSPLTNGNTCWYLAGELPNQLPNYDPKHFALVLFQGSFCRNLWIQTKLHTAVHDQSSG